MFLTGAMSTGAWVAILICMFPIFGGYFVFRLQQKEQDALDPSTGDSEETDSESEH